MNLKYTQMKENYTSNIFFLTDQENETQSLSNKDESRKKNKQKWCVRGEKAGTTGSNHFFSDFVSDATLKKPCRV